MHFTPAIAAAILSFTSSAVAAPGYGYSSSCYNGQCVAQEGYGSGGVTAESNVYSFSGPEKRWFNHGGRYGNRPSYGYDAHKGGDFNDNDVAQAQAQAIAEDGGDANAIANAVNEKRWFKHGGQYGYRPSYRYGGQGGRDFNDNDVAQAQAQATAEDGGDATAVANAINEKRSTWGGYGHKSYRHGYNGYRHGDDYGHKGYGYGGYQHGDDFNDNDIAQAQAQAIAEDGGDATAVANAINEKRSTWSGHGHKSHGGYGHSGYRYGGDFNDNDVAQAQAQAFADDGGDATAVANAINEKRAASDGMDGWGWDGRKQGGRYNGGHHNGKHHQNGNSDNSDHSGSSGFSGYNGETLTFTVTAEAEAESTVEVPLDQSNVPVSASATAVAVAQIPESIKGHAYCKVIDSEAEASASVEQITEGWHKEIRAQAEAEASITIQCEYR